MTLRQVGLWRSLVARPSGGRKVAGSSPASPTNLLPNPPSTWSKPTKLLRGWILCKTNGVQVFTGQITLNFEWFCIVFLIAMKNTVSSCHKVMELKAKGGK